MMDRPSWEWEQVVIGLMVRARNSALYCPSPSSFPIPSDCARLLFVMCVWFPIESLHYACRLVNNNHALRCFSSGIRGNCSLHHPYVPHGLHLAWCTRYVIISNTAGLPKIAFPPVVIWRDLLALLWKKQQEHILCKDYDDLNRTYPGVLSTFFLLVCS